MAETKEKKYIIENSALMAEWDWAKNNKIGLDPHRLTLGSNKKAWWICNTCHNEWQASIYHRGNNHGCPICARKKASENGVKSKRQKNGSLADKFPELMREWDFQRNTESPFEISYGTSKKAWWLCSNGHSFSMSVVSRTSRNSQCPICLGRQVSMGQNDFESQCTDLLPQWNYRRNIIKPYEITRTSYKKVWWVCEKGHEWEAAVYNRVILKQGCPHCYNEAHKVNENNNLQILYPLIALEWNYNKNAPYTPSDVKATSVKKFWWVCEKGHEWETAPHSRINGSGCPYCASYQAKVSQDNCLEKSMPDLVLEWNYEKNGQITPRDVRAGSKKKVWWKCKVGHEWQAAISSRAKGRGCPICNKEYKTSFPEQAVFFYIKKLFPDAVNGYISDEFEIDIFIPSLALGIEYDGMAYHIGAKSLEKETRKNEYCISKGIRLIRLKETQNFLLKNTDSVIWCHYEANNRFLNAPIHLLLNDYLLIENPSVDVERDSIEIQNQYIFSVKEKSFALLHPELASEWHPTKNGSLKPEYVRAASNKKYWWLCSKGHEYEMTALNRHNGMKCPYCSGRRILVGYNDLNTLFPQLALQWDYDKNNDVTPQKVTAGTNRKFWWKCEKGHSWQTSITTRVAGGNCPYCGNQKLLQGFNDLATTHPQIAAEWDYEKNGDLKPTQVIAHNDIKLWWICCNGHSYQSTIKRRKRGLGCPICQK